MSAWGSSWGQAWADAWGALGPEVVHPLGHVTLDMRALVGLAADPQVEVDVADDELVGSGGPDDETLDPRARKWLRERYKKQPEPTQVVRGAVRVHIPDEDGSTPSPATIIEAAPAVDVAPLERDLAVAARQAIEVVEKARKKRDDDNRRRAMAIVLALLDD